MSFSIETSSLFIKELKALYKKYPSIKKDISELGERLLLNPKQGVLLGRDGLLQNKVNYIVKIKRQKRGSKSDHLCKDLS
jgi:mRNA-degrading endonuclease RelE of RelBE toxin-antitoxin system